MSELKPFTRDMITMLKANHDADIHSIRVAEETKRIYDKFLTYATTAKICICTIEVDKECHDIVDDVIYELNKAFPDCSIKHKTLTRGVNGHMYDTSLMYDPIGIRLQKKQFHRLYITIDWSY